MFGLVFEGHPRLDRRDNLAKFPAGKSFVELCAKIAPHIRDYDGVIKTDQNRVKLLYIFRADAVQIVSALLLTPRLP